LVNDIKLDLKLLPSSRLSVAYVVISVITHDGKKHSNDENLHVETKSYTAHS